MQVALGNSALCGLFLLVLNGSVRARDLDQDEALRMRQAGHILPLEQLLDEALRQYPGAPARGRAGRGRRHPGL